MSDCVISTFAKDKAGYARCWFRGKPVLHHRMIYCIAAGVDMDAIAGLSVMHTCDNPGCINPAHLKLGTHADNMRDKKNKGRAPRGEDAGRAKLTEKQVIEIRGLASIIQYRLLATQYGVSVPTIKDIVARKIWKHI
jgi:hypothetical protein